MIRLLKNMDLITPFRHQRAFEALVPRAGLVGYWDFVRDAKDWNGHNYDATLSGSAAVAGGALQLGSGNYASIAHNSAFNGLSSGAAISVWINPTSGYDYDRILVKSNANNTGWMLALDSSSNHAQWLMGNGSSWGVNLVSSTSLTDGGGWQHILINIAGTGSNQTRMYINSVDEDQGTYSSNYADSSQPIRVGRWDFNTSYYYGDIGPIVFYGRALSTDEITQIYNAQKGYFE